MTRSRLGTAGRIALVTLVCAGAGVGGYAATLGIHNDHAARFSATAAPPAAYSGAGAAAGGEPVPSVAPRPAPAAVARALQSVVAAPGLGSRLRAEVVDVVTGAVLYDHGGTGRAAPASTAKLLTATAILSVRPVTYRIKTEVVAGAAGAVVLVGAGDPTLTGAARGKIGAYPHAGRISDLADQLKRARLNPSRIVVDDGLYSGARVSPAWAPGDVPSDYAAAITPVMTDGGRAAPGDVVRSAEPDLAAGRELAQALARPNLSVTRGRAPASGSVLATVESAPLGTLVEQMLLTSDNVIAECLARQVALAEHLPASFAGAAAAVRSVLRRLGVDPGTGLVDGSGLAARDRVSPAALANVIRVAASAPERTGRRTVIAALPVAGWSGTLANRYISGSTASAAGLVRAKTGTLTGVSSLAGTVRGRTGRLLAFAFIADRAPAITAAEAALDAIAARLATCGCA